MAWLTALGVGLLPATAGARTSAGASRIATTGEARKPYMGWNSYYGLGLRYDEGTIVSVTDAIVARGLPAVGYRYVWLDAGWWSGPRDATGAIVVDARQWPHGMKWLADYIHAKGLLAGIYTDAGPDGCGRAGNLQGGSFGHYHQDANQFAAWGYDAVKVDYCGARTLGVDPARPYRAFAHALRYNASHRAILLNVCNSRHNRFGYRYSHRFAPTIAASWRTGADLGVPQAVPFSGVLRNLDDNAAHPEAAGPGHWNDPDYLVPELGLSDVEAQTQFTMWVMMAAPLVLGTDVRTMSESAQRVVTNPRAIAIDRDRAGVQGTRIARHGAREVWAKPLANGDRAVALLNRGYGLRRISTSAKALGLAPARRYRVLDIWTGHRAVTSGRIVGTVFTHGAVLLRVSRRRR
jgi:alpha-galactosidase